MLSTIIHTLLIDELKQKYFRENPQVLKVQTKSWMLTAFILLRRRRLSRHKAAAGSSSRRLLSSVLTSDMIAVSQSNLNERNGRQ